MDNLWKQITKEQLASLYWDEGLSTYEIAERYGLKTEESVRKKMARMEISRRVAGGQREFKPDREEPHALYQEMGIRRIARRYGVGQTVVFKRLKELGITVKDYEDGGHRKKPGRLFSESHKKALSAAHRAREAKGPKASNWRGGIAVHNWKARNSTEYKEWRRLSKQRVNNCCEECGVTDGHICECCGTAVRLQVHHVLSFAGHPERRYDPENRKVDSINT